MGMGNPVQPIFCWGLVSYAEREYRNDTIAIALRDSQATCKSKRQNLCGVLFDFETRTFPLCPSFSNRFQNPPINFRSVTPMSDQDQLQAELQQLRAQVAELKAENFELEALLESLPDHIYFKDRQSRFTRINRAMAKSLGLDDPTKAIGKTDEDFFTKEHAKPALDAEKKIIESGEPLVGLVEKETWANGLETWVSTTKLPLRNEQGEIIGTFGVSRNVTEMVQAQNKLRDSEAIFHSLVDNLIQNIFRKDLTGHLTFVNQQYCKELGKTSDELIGKTDFDLFPEELAEKYVIDDQRVIETGKTLELVEKHLLPDGQVQFVQVVKTPVFDAQHHIIGTQGIFWDVTEKKRYEQTLERLAAIVESSDDGIIGTTVDGVIESWNSGAERLYGYTASEVIGKDIKKTVPLELRYEVDSIKSQLQAGERISNLETVRVTKEGRRIDVSLSVAPIRDSSGKVVGVSGIARDISERKQTEQALSQLAAIVSSTHDAIIGHTLEGKITTWNTAAEKLYGYSAQDVLNQSITRLSPPDRQDELFRLVGRIAREERIENYRTQHVTRAGQPLDVTLTVSPILDHDQDRVLGISIIARPAAAE